MRILVHDHAGHPPQVQMARSLARRGHQVLLSYCASLQTPRGPITVQKDDPDTIAVKGVGLSKNFSRYSLLYRFMQEKELGRKMVELIDQFQPEVILSANTPLGTQAAMQKRSKKGSIQFIYWATDLFGIGIQQNIKKKLPFLGNLIGWYYRDLDKSLLKRSDQVIVLSEDFEPFVVQSGISQDKVHVVRNWAPLDELSLTNGFHWVKENNLQDKRRIIYSGTLGMKHNPELLVDLAQTFKEQKDVSIIVISEGLGADYLSIKKKELGLDNLILMPFLPYDELASALISADVLVAILERDAGQFSVPSKVLSYMCAGKPLLLSVPLENLAARVVQESDSGIVVSPDDTEGFVNGACDLIQDSFLRDRFGQNARDYAEKHFDIEKKTDQFESIIFNSYT